MATALSIFGVTFAASCVWLIVRIVNRRERWAKWTLATIIAVVGGYSLSYGSWIGYSGIGPRWIRDAGKIVFNPLERLNAARCLPDFYRAHLNRWALVAANRNVAEMRRMIGEPRLNVQPRE